MHDKIMQRHFIWHNNAIIEMVRAQKFKSIQTDYFSFMSAFVEKWTEIHSMNLSSKIQCTNN